MAESYREIYKAEEGQLGQYFRNLEHLIKFVDNETIEHERRYTSLVKAQLSQFETALLFYHCIRQRKEPFTKLVELVEKFGFLKHLRREFLLDASHHKRFLDERAFK